MKTTTKEKIEIMQAWLDKKEIQYFAKNKKIWEMISSHEEPNWNWLNVDYRIKPNSYCIRR